jgi:hypothetical protein
MYHSLARRIITAAHESDPELSAIWTDLRNEIAQLPDSDDITVPLDLYVSRLVLAVHRLRDKTAVTEPNVGDRVAIDLGHDTYFVGTVNESTSEGLYVTPNKDANDNVFIPWNRVNDILVQR